MMGYLLKTQHEERQLAAYYEWQAAGCPEGSGDHFWFEAERKRLEKVIASNWYKAAVEMREAIRRGENPEVLEKNQQLVSEAIFTKQYEAVDVPSTLSFADKGSLTISNSNGNSVTMVDGTLTLTTDGGHVMLSKETTPELEKELAAVDNTEPVCITVSGMPPELTQLFLDMSFEPKVGDVINLNEETYLIVPDPQMAQDEQMPWYAKIEEEHPEVKMKSFRGPGHLISYLLNSRKKKKSESSS